MADTWNVPLEQFLEISKALSSEVRMNIFTEIQKRTMSIQEISELFQMPLSTATINVKKLEDAKLIRTEMVPGVRGLQKVCSVLHDRLIVDLRPSMEVEERNFTYIEMPIGHFVDCKVLPTCGLASEHSLIGFSDEPRSFYEPDRIHAQLIWLRQGYLEYQFPNKTPYDCLLKSVEVSMEICSEAPGYKLDWPSDITVWINGIELGTWMSPGDFGGTRGFFTPLWWEQHLTQHGLLKKWRVSEDGTFIDGTRVSSVTISDLNIDGSNSFTMRVGIAEDSPNQGGINLFGKKFGNYDQDILLRMDFEPKRH